MNNLVNRDFTGWMYVLNMKCMYVAFPLDLTLTKVSRVHPYVWPALHALLM